MLPTIVILHGLNNTTESFHLLGEEFKKMGYPVKYFSLLGHSRELMDDISLRDSIDHLKSQLSSLNEIPYIFIGFSQGALLFQLTLEELVHKPLKQILISPAFKVKNQFFLNLALKFLPKNLKMKTQTPNETRQYSEIFPSYYKVLFSKIKELDKVSSKILNSIPTYVCIDPKDELIDIKAMLKFFRKKKLNWSFYLFSRKEISFGYKTKHHVLFHPSFFTPNEWSRFISNLSNFINKN